MYLCTYIWNCLKLYQLGLWFYVNNQTKTQSPIFFFYQLYYTGTEQFNTKPIKGITFLQEQGLLSDPLDPGEVVTFLKENPRLDKAMIGEYVAKKSNHKVLEAFVK